MFSANFSTEAARKLAYKFRAARGTTAMTFTSLLNPLKYQIENDKHSYGQPTYHFIKWISTEIWVHIGFRPRCPL